MAGIIAVYSLVIAVLIAGAMDPEKKYSLFKCVGRAGLHLEGYTDSAVQWVFTSRSRLVGGYDWTCRRLRDWHCWRLGTMSPVRFYALSADSKKGVRAYMQQSRIFVGMVLILIFAEVLGLYGYALPSLKPLVPQHHGG